MIYTVSCQHNGKAPNYEHNRRTKKYIEKEMFTSVDLQRPHYTYVDENIKDTYRQLFGASLEEWNKKNIKNKHSDRVISFDDWFEKIKLEGNQYRHELNEAKKIKDVKKREKAIKSLFARPRLVYEAIIQFGNMDTVPALHTEERKEFDETVKKIFDKYVEDWKKNNPTLHLTGVYMHFDEVTPHMHIDYIPVVENQKSGMKTAPKLKQAYLQLGFEDGHLSYTPQMQWQDHQRDILIDIAKEFELEAEFDDRRRRGIKTLKQYGKEPFKYKIDRFAETDKQAEEKNIKIQELQTTIEQLTAENDELSARRMRQKNDIANKNEIQSKQNKNIAINDKKIKSQESKLSSLKDKIQSLESYSKSIIDMATLEANEVIEKAKKKGKELINQAEEKVSSMLKLGEAQKEKLIKDGEAYFDNFVEEGENEYREIISNAKKEAKEIEDKAKTDADKIINDAKEQKKDLEKQIAIKNDSLRDIELNYDHVQNAIEEVMENIKNPDYRKQVLEKNELYLLREVYSMENTIIERFKKAQLKYTEILPSDYITELNKNYKMFQKLLNDAYSQHGYEVPYPEIQPKVSQPEHDFGHSR